MGSSSKVPSPSHRISRHAHHPLPAAGPCSGHTQASSGLLHLPSPLPEIPGHGKRGQGTAQFLASSSVLLGRGSALAGCSICSHAQCFSPLLLTPSSSSYHQSTACISGWLSQLRLKQCWVTTIPRAQRPQAANTGFPHWRVHRWSGKDSSRLGLGLGSILVSLYSLWTSWPLTTSFSRKLNLKAKVLGGRIRRSSHTILSRQCLSWPRSLLRAGAGCCGMFVYTVKMGRCS